MKRRRYRWWEWHRGMFYVSLDLSNCNRPYAQIDEERPRKWAALSWGNRNSDPVWSVQIPLRRSRSEKGAA